jgi:hypothetical protein
MNEKWHEENYDLLPVAREADLRNLLHVPLILHWRNLKTFQEQSSSEKTRILEELILIFFTYILGYARESIQLDGAIRVADDELVLRIGAVHTGRLEVQALGHTLRVRPRA